MPSNLFAARLLGYLVGLVPLLAMFLMARHILPQNIGLILLAAGALVSIWIQQKARALYPYNFRSRAEWLALGTYIILVLALVVLISRIWY